MSTIVLDTIEDRLTSRQVAVSGLGYQWVLQDTLNASADSSFTIHGNGFDQGLDGVEFLDDYEYLLTGEGVYGNTDSAYLQGHLYEPSQRNAANDYVNSYFGHSGGTGAEGTSSGTFGSLCSSTWGTSIQESCVFETHIRGVKAGQRTHWWSNSTGEINAGTIKAFSAQVWAYDAGGNSSILKADHLVAFPSAGPVTGLFKLYSRKAL